MTDKSNSTQQTMSDVFNQKSLTDFRAGTTTQEVIRTFRIKLTGSEWKYNRVKQAIEDFQRVAQHTANILPSFPPHRWGSRDTQLGRVVRDQVSDLCIYAHDRNSAMNKAREAFASWHANGQQGDRPIGRFGDSDYFRMSTSSSSKNRRQIVSNEQGYGLELSLINDRNIEPSSMWFHMDVGAYQHEWLEKVVNNEAEIGVVELRYDNADQLWAHISISHPVEVYEAADVKYLGGKPRGFVV